MLLKLNAPPSLMLMTQVPLTDVSLLPTEALINHNESQNVPKLSGLSLSVKCNFFTMSRLFAGNFYRCFLRLKSFFNCDFKPNPLSLLTPDHCDLR